MSRQVFRSLALGDVHDGHEHAVESSGRRREREREEDGEPLPLQILNHPLGLEGRAALGEAHEHLDERRSGLGHGDLVQGDEELDLAAGREELDRGIVDVDDPHAPRGVPDELGVRGEVCAEIAHATGSQLIDRRLDLGEIFLEDRNSG